MDKRNHLSLIHKFFVLTLTLGFLIGQPAYSKDKDPIEPQPLSAEEAFSLTVSPAEGNKIELHYVIAPSYVLYKENFNFKTLDGQALDIDPTVFPKPIIKHDKVLGEYAVYTKELKLLISPSATQNDAKKGFRVEYQGCSEDGFCYAPIAKEVVYQNGAVSVTDLSPEQFLASTASSSVEKPGENVKAKGPACTHITSETDFLTTQLKEGAFPITFLLFLGLGILLAFTPCVLPMLPILANILVGEDTPLSSRRSILLASIYVLSVALCYSIAGVAAGLMGNYFQLSLQRPFFLIGLSVLLLLFALNQFNLLHVPLPQGISNALNNFQSKQKQGSILGAFVMGIISALLVSPCVTPALVGALSYIGQTGNAILGGMALFALALGMGLPLLVITCVGSHYLPKTGPWMGYIKIITGVLLLILAGIFLMRGINQFYVSDFEKKVAMNFTVIQSKDELESALKEAKNAKKTAILDVYAEWCASCVKLDEEIFTNDAILSKLKDVKLLRLDVTKQTEDIKELKKHLDIIGPPTLLFFGADGVENKDYRVVGKIGPDDFIDHVKHAFAPESP